MQLLQQLFHYLCLFSSQYLYFLLEIYDYKHTYFSSTNLDKFNNLDRKTAKLNILRKFKKELPTPKDEAISEAQLEEEILNSQEEINIQEEQAVQIQEQETTQSLENLSENQNENL